jgi:ketosteroid isomerase-like protein
MTPTRRARTGLPVLAALALVVTSLAQAQGIEAPRVPLRTAIKELATVRSEYADLYNQKNVAALTTMYLQDAVVIRADGSTLLGQAAIGKSLAEEAQNWKQITITSDTMRVFGNTAWDVGRLSSPGPDGEARAQHYLVVLRRGVQTWKISSLAVVPETRVTDAN